jgi:hypothetical protein
VNVTALRRMLVVLRHGLPHLDGESDEDESAGDLEELPEMTVEATDLMLIGLVNLSKSSTLRKLLRYNRSLHTTSLCGAANPSSDRVLRIRVHVCDRAHMRISSCL